MPLGRRASGHDREPGDPPQRSDGLFTRAGCLWHRRLLCISLSASARPRLAGVCLLLCLCALPWPTHAGVVGRGQRARRAHCAGRRPPPSGPTPKISVLLQHACAMAASRCARAGRLAAQAPTACWRCGVSDAARALKTRWRAAVAAGQSYWLSMAEPASACKAAGAATGPARHPARACCAFSARKPPPPAAPGAAERQPLLARWLRARQWWQADGADHRAVQPPRCARCRRAEAAIARAGVSPGARGASEQRAEHGLSRARLAAAWKGATLSLRAAPTVLVRCGFG